MWQGVECVAGVGECVADSGGVCSGEWGCFRE